LEGEHGIEGSDALQFRLRYVPDKLIFDAESFTPYLESLTSPDAWISLEASAAHILDDVNNEIVPRWIQVTLTRTPDADLSSSHSVMLEDRQPKWDNSALLGRVGAF
jgi:7-cyano-7-deazaguanine reductase